MASSSKWLAPGAIIAYAVGGGVVLFIILSVLCIIFLRAREQQLLGILKRRGDSPLLMPPDRKRISLLPFPPACIDQSGLGYSLSDFEQEAPSTLDDASLIQYSQPARQDRIVPAASDQTRGTRISWPLRSKRAITAPFPTDGFVKSPLSAITESPRSRSVSTPDPKEIFELPAESEAKLARRLEIIEDDERPETPGSNETIWPTVAGQISRPKPKGPRKTPEQQRRESKDESTLSVALQSRRSNNSIVTRSNPSACVTEGPHRRIRASSVSVVHSPKSNNRHSTHRASLSSDHQFACSSKSFSSSVIRTEISSPFTRGSESTRDQIFDSPPSVISSYISDSPSSWYGPSPDGRPSLRTALTTPSFERQGAHDSYQSLLHFGNSPPSQRSRRRRSSSLALSSVEANWASLFGRSRNGSNRDFSDTFCTTEPSPSDIVTAPHAHRRPSSSATSIIRSPIAGKGTFGLSGNENPYQTISGDDCQNEGEKVTSSRSPLLLKGHRTSNNMLGGQHSSPTISFPRPISDLKSAQETRLGHRRHRSMQRPYFVPHDVNSTVVIETAEDRTPSPVKETVFGNSNRSAESDQLSMSKTQEASYRTGADLMYSPTLSIYNCYHATNGHESEKKTSGPLLSPDSDIDSDQDNFFSIERKSFLPENASPIHGLRTKDLSFPVGSGREGHTPLWSPADSTNFALTDPPQTWIGSRASWIQGPRDQPSEASVRKSILQLRRMDSEAARWKSSTASKMYLSMGQLRNVSPSACASGTGGEESVYENVYARSPALESTEFRRAESKRRKAAVKLYNRSRSDSMYDKDGFLKV